MLGRDLDLSQPRRIHLIGIGGAGMNAIATVLADMGHTVSGSDLKDSVALERLRARGLDVHVGHEAAHVPTDADAVSISTAIPETNPEVVAARERGIPVLRRAATLAAIVRTRRPIAVGGTHGKTTTASMLALVMIEAGLHPSFIIGGDVNEIGTGAVWDEGEWFVVEADESDGTFVELDPEVTVTTNIEPDHLEHYGGFEPLRDAFRTFIGQGEGPSIVCADDPLAAQLGREAGAVSYGFAEGADYRLTGLEAGRDGTTFSIVHEGEELTRLHLPVPGRHNASNAGAALVTGHLVGASMEAGCRAMERFAGVARRFQFRGEAQGIEFVDDYAHLPTEVRAALEATQDGDWDRVVCVFQPHRFSRMAALWPEFADAFEGADLLVVTDIYPAGEAPRPGVSGKLVVNAVLDAHPWHRVAYLPKRPDLVPYLRSELRPGDLCLTLGAGDLTSLPDEVQAALA
jgi:UDP-N-acetylmuramate--alanine ligase